MHRIDENYMKHPYFGYRRMTRILKYQGCQVNRKRVRRLMQVMGLEAYPKPNLSKRLRAYLLRGLTINRQNQGLGNRYHVFTHGQGLHVSVSHYRWVSRKVIDYKLSNALEKTFVLRCLKRALHSAVANLEIMNSDQGSHFTNGAYLDLLEKKGIMVSTDGKGRATDNSRTERFFRSLMYECIYINKFEDPCALRQGITRYVQFYNEGRPHHSLGEAMPIQFYAHEIKQIAS